jgi:CRISPR-associated protein Csx16
MKEITHMTTLFVTLHPGAIEWAQRQSLEVDKTIPHLDVEQVQPEDSVIGILPVNLVADVCRRGGCF